MIRDHDDHICNGESTNNLVLEMLMLKEILFLLGFFFLLWNIIMIITFFFPIQNNNQVVKTYFALENLDLNSIHFIVVVVIVIVEEEDR